MELVSLHPFDPEIAARYVAALKGEREPDTAWRTWWSPALPEAVMGAAAGREAAARTLSLGLAWALSAEHPAFVREGFGLTNWEARIDRGVGMLMRPPSRLFIDAGLERRTAQVMPIRLELEEGMMGGAYVPSRLMGGLAELMDTRLERMAKRLAEAEYDPFAMLGLMHQAVAYARERDLGLYEAQDAVGLSPNMRIIEAAEKKRMDGALRERIEAAIAPEKKAGFISRLLGRKKPEE